MRDKFRKGDTDQGMQGLIGCGEACRLGVGYGLRVLVDRLNKFITKVLSAASGIW